MQGEFPPPPVKVQVGTQLEHDTLQNARNLLITGRLVMVEAGGVEPPSEKRYATEPTCLSQFRLFRPPRLERARNAAG